MGQALYRKYRSKSLDEVVGQQHVTDILRRAISLNRISHAYLLTGPRGVGKTSIARILASEINGLPYQGEKNHLDIIEIDAASNRRIDDIRELREKVHIAPVSARYKVYIIDEVHMLTGESFNALLKTLEEPPAHVVFILATTEVQKIPATIISRVQRFSFRPISLDTAVDHLRSIVELEKINIDDEALQLIAEYGNGSLRDSIGLLDQLASSSAGQVTAGSVQRTLGLAPRKLLNDLLKAISEGDAPKVIAIHHEFESQGISALSLTTQVIKALRKQAETDIRTFELIDTLLEVSKSSDPNLKLLTSLLRHVISPKKTNEKSNLTNKSAAAIVGTAKKDILSSEIQKSKEPEEKIKPKATDQITESEDKPAFDISIWPDVLARVAIVNSPLYSVLKRASMTFEDNKLTLSFNFILHKKKIDNPKYRAQLAAVISQICQQCPEIVAVIDKTKAAKSAPPETTKQPPAATNSSPAAMIIDIMGGGEMTSDGTKA